MYIDSSKIIMYIIAKIDRKKDEEINGEIYLIDDKSLVNKRNANLNKLNTYFHQKG